MKSGARPFIFTRKRKGGEGRREGGDKQRRGRKEKSEERKGRVQAKGNEEDFRENGKQVAL